MSAISFDILGSSGAKQWQVSEGQPFPETLQTQYFMFGYQFDPTSWTELKERSGPYNPMNDLLNPLNVGPDELLQRQSLEYIEEQMVRQRWNDLKEKEAFLRLVPDQLKRTIGALWDNGTFKASQTQTEMDKTVDSLITQGTLGSYDAGRLRALISQRATFSQLSSQRSAENNLGQLEAIMNNVQSAIEALGISRGNTRQTAREAVGRALDLGITQSREITRVALRNAESILRRAEEVEAPVDPIGGRGGDIDEYVAEADITDGQALADAGVGLGSRYSAPVAFSSSVEERGTGAERPSYREMLQRRVAEEINVPNVLPSRRDVEIAGEALGGRPQILREAFGQSGGEEETMRRTFVRGPRGEKRPIPVKGVGRGRK